MAKKKKSNKSNKIKTTTIRSVPQWASYYLRYGESEGISEKEKKMVDDWVEGLRKEGYRLIEPIEVTENEFDPWPAFGLPCAVQDWLAEVVNKEEL